MHSATGTDRPLALVTGATRRIGAAFSVHLAQQGYDLLLHTRSSGLGATAADCTQAGAAVHTCFADLSDDQQVMDLCDRLGNIADRAGGIALVVHSASVFLRAEFGDLDYRQLLSTFGANLFAPLLLTQQAPLADQALVVHMLDSRVARARKQYLGYSLSKQAFAEATLQMARMLAPRVRVNAICPGPILPPAEMEPQQAQPYMDKLAASTPLARAPTMADLIAALDYLRSAQTVTGQLLFVDSGEHLV